MPRKSPLLDLPGISPDVHFAPYQVQAAVADTLSALQPRPSRVLLVGLPEPFPGELLEGSEIVSATVDVEAWSRKAVTALEYQNGEFACVFACDVLDKLHSSVRPAMVEELARVSSQLVIVLSPFDSQVVSSAEESVNEIHRSATGKPHPDILFHREQGLPDLRKTCDTLMDYCEQTPEVFPVSSLRTWTLLQMLSFAAASAERGDLVFSRLNRFYNERFARVDHGTPSYRHMLISVKGSKALRAGVIKQLADRFRKSPCRPEIDTMRDLMRMALDGYAEALSSPRVKGVQAATARQIQELERKVRTQARSIEKLQDEIFRLKNPKSPARLLKKLFTF